MSSEQLVKPQAVPRSNSSVGGGVVGYIFPEKAKENNCDSVRSLRSTILLLIVGHLICGVLNIAFLGSFLGALA